MTLSNPSGGLLGTRATTTVTIQDNDPGLGFESVGYSVWEGEGEVKLVVLRGNDWGLGPITVDYATSNLTATAGSDYQARSDTLEFKANESLKSLAIPVFRDALVEGAQTFRVTLSNATGGATLGRATTTVTMQDNYFTVVPPFNSLLAVRRDGEDYLRLRPLAEGQGFLYCYPDGTINQWGYRFWNATDAVGDYGSTGVDDAGKRSATPLWLPAERRAHPPGGGSAASQSAVVAALCRRTPNAARGSIPGFRPPVRHDLRQLCTCG